MFDVFLGDGMTGVVYAKIGPAGVVLILLSLAAVYLSVKNWLLLFFIGRDFRRRFKRIESGERAYAEELCGKVANPLVGIIADVVKTHAAHSEDLRAEVAYLFHRNFEKVNRDIAFLKLIAVISPLLGLLGTMLGMVAVFGVLATEHAAANAATLAAGIWEALLTTIMGLSVAIPTLVLFYALSLRMKGFHIEAIEHSYRAVELFERMKADSGENSGEDRAASGLPGHSPGFSFGRAVHAGRRETRREAC